MRRVTDRLYIGDTHDAAGWTGPLVSACQTWHYRRIGCTRQNPPAKDREDYIVAEGDNWLSLNWVDGPAHLYEWGGPEPWRRAFDFIDRQTEPVLVHCDQGCSRAPVLAAVYLAKRGDVGGIADWAAQNWDIL